MPKTILVTGATGYIAKHIVLQLLEAGYHVRGSVRSPARGDEVTAAVTPLLTHPQDLEQRLQFVPLDLTQDEGWDAAMDGVDVLMHTASPFPLNQPDDPDALIRPAVDGTLRALRAAHATGVKRVIMTSSTVAVTGLVGDGPVDETNWTDPDDADITAYTKSKTLAERAAWDFVTNDASEMQLTTVNPGFVLGAPLDEHYGTSVGVIARLLRGKDPMLPNIGFVTVDVRDVAEMHVTAIENADTFGRRIMTVDKFLTFAEMAKAVKAAHPDRRVPTRTAPDFLIRLMARFDPAIKSILPGLGRVDRVDNSRARAVLGRGMRQAHKAAAQTADYLVEKRLV